MKQAILIAVCAAILSTGCTSYGPLLAQQKTSPDGTHAQVEGRNTRPDLRQLPLQGKINFGYKIYGDPGAAPSQVFDDGRYIYLQFRQDEAPPIPITRDGKLLEYQVLHGGLVKIPKVDTVTLRLGPRVAFVDRAELEIISLAGSSGPLSSVSAPGPAPTSWEESLLKVEPPPPVPPSPAIPISAPTPLSPPSERTAVAVERYTIDLFDKDSAKRSLAAARLAPGTWRLCHAPTVRDLAAAQALRSMLQTEYKDLRVLLSDSCTRSGQAVLERLPKGAS